MLNYPLTRLYPAFSDWVRVWAILSLLTGSVWAQPSTLCFQHLTTADGLSQSINPFIYRDAYGFVWISSLDGLNRFDGLSIKVYRADAADRQAMRGNNIQSPFFEDADHNLWFCTYQAINCYRRATDDFSTFQIQGEQAPIESGYRICHRDPGGRLWVLANSELYWYTPPAPNHPVALQKRIGTLQSVKYFPEVSAASGEVLRIYGCNVRFRHGIEEYRIRDSTVRLEQTWLDGRDGRDSAKIYHILPEGNDLLWLGSEDGLLRFNRRSGRVEGAFRQINGQSTGTVRGIVVLDANHLFVSSERGLLIFDKRIPGFVQQFTHQENDACSLASNQLNEIYLDAARNIWVSRWAGGVDFAQLDKVKFHQLPGARLALPGETGFVAGAMATDPQGAIWCGSNMAALRRLHRDETVEGLLLPDGRSLRALKLYTLDNGDLLLSSYYDGCYWYSRQKRFIPIVGSDGTKLRFNDFYQLKDGSVLAGGNGGVYQITLLANQATAQRMALPEVGSSSVQRLAQDQRGRLYIAKDFKTIVVLQQHGSVFSVVRQIDAAGEVKAFLEQANGMWAGGDFGLLWINKTEDMAGAPDLPESLAGNTVYGLLPGKDEELWMSTNQGLVRYSPARGDLRRYSLADGLQDYEFNSNSSLRTADGRLWFGGIRGLNVFHPDSIQDLQLLPQVYLTGLRVNDQAFAPDSNITQLNHLILPYDSSTLSFEFVALEFSDPHSNQLRYRLQYANGELYDQDWVRCKDARGFARYANLTPGRYEFWVMGANSDGVWNPLPRKLLITITPPFWQTWWFRLLAAGALLAAIYAAVRAYIRDKLRRRDLEIREKNLRLEKQEALTQERNRIAGEMHDDLGGGLTSIRMLSERVQDKIDQPDTRVQVDKIARYSQELIQKMGEIIWAMNSNFDTVENLIAYIRRYAVEYLDTNHLRAVIREPDIIPAATVSGERRRNIYLAVKESLHNIVKHAGATRVNISFEISAEQLVIQVSDDGRGIDADQLNQFGNGLHNMRKRLRDIGGDLHITNEDGARLTFHAPFEN